MRMQGASVSCVIAALIGALLVLAAPSVARAQAPSPYTYCFSGTCYQSRAEAEAAMRAYPHAVAPYLEPSGTWLMPSGEFLLEYRAPDQAPVAWGDISYAPNLYVVDYYCEPASNPFGGSTGCASEDEAIEMTIAHLTKYNGDGGCFNVNFTMSGSWAEPFETILGSPGLSGDGRVLYTGEGRTLHWDTVCNGTLHGSSSTGFQKHQRFLCPAGFDRNMALTRTPEEMWADGRRVCGANVTFSVSTAPLQTASCPANENPCYPATGNKARFERDLVFAGRSIERVYHSSMQTVSESLSRGWRYSFEETMVQGGAPNTYHYIDARGYLSRFKFANNSAAIASDPEGSGRTLHRTPTTPGANVWLQDPSGDVRTFDDYGRLLSISNERQPNTNIYLSYAELPHIRRVTHIADSAGRRIELDYGLSGKLTGMVAYGTVPVEIVYDSRGDLAEVAVAGERRLYHYEGDVGYLTGITDEAGTRYASFAYDARGRVKESFLHDGADVVEHTQLNYVSTDMVEVTTADGDVRTYRMSTNPFRRVDSVTDGRGTVNTQYFGEQPYVVTGVDGVITESYATFANSRVDEAVGTAFERRTERDYDGRSNVTRESVWDGPEGDRTLQRLSTFTYDDEGRIQSSCEHDVQMPGAAAYTCGSSALAPAGVRQVRRAYCTAQDVNAALDGCAVVGALKSVDGARTDVADITSYAYYTQSGPSCGASGAGSCGYNVGDLWQVQDPTGGVTETLKYDWAGRPTSVRNPAGVVIDYEYHPRGWLTATKIRGADDGSEVDDRITAIDYWPTGLVKQVTQPDGAFTTYGYDTAHRLTTIGDSDGNTITYTLDNAGNRVQEDTRDDNGTLLRTLSRLYNQLGQLATQADASDNPTDFTYDPNGNLKTATDPLGRATSNDYDPLKRLARTLQDIGGVEAETTFEYDALDHLTRVTDPKGLETGYTYNAFGDLLQLDSPDTGTTTYTYDSVGNRTGQVDARGQASSYAYDALNRLTGISYDGAADQNVTYVYDTVPPGCDTGETFAIGRLSAMADASGSTQYCYDRFGQMVRKVQATNGQTFTLRYAYTKSGQLSSLTYPDGSTADYVRDAQGRVTEVGVTSPGGSREVLLTDASYAPFGPATGWAYGNGRTLSRAHDLDYRPQSILDSATGGLDLGYSYDPAGNLTALRTADLAEPPRATFDYDALNRLTAFRDGAAGAAIERYDYDATGNRTGFTNAGGTQAYAYPTDSHRLASVAGVPRTYDASGNTTAVGSAREFVYNAANRLSQVKQGGTITMHYAYNGKGERVRRHLGTDDVTTVYDEAGRWVGDYDDAGVPLQQAIWLDDNPVGLLVGATGVNRLHYVQPDHLGTPRAVIDPIRNVAVWKWDLASEAFGNSPPNQDPDGDGTGFVFDMRFPGQRYDAATGLNYNYFRDYESSSGRYSQSDPIGLGGGPNTYEYSMSMPTSAFDPKGLTAVRLPPYKPGQQLPHGTIYCDDGVVAPFVNWKRWPAYDRECFGDCLVVHEQSHVRDATRSNPGVCRYRGWVPFIYPRGIVSFDSRQARLNSEFRAYAAELRCLASKLTREGGCNSGLCRKVITGRISDIVEIILPTVHNGTYPYGVPGHE